MARQTPAKHDSSAVVSSSADASATSRKAMRVISRAFHKRKGRKFSAAIDSELLCNSASIRRGPRSAIEISGRASQRSSPGSRCNRSAQICETDRRCMSASSPRGKSCKKSGSEPSQPDVISLSVVSTWTGLSDPLAFDFIQRACELIAPLN